MPTEWLEALPKLVAIVEKGGIIGLFIVVVAALIWDRIRLRKDLIETYHERDLCRMVRVRYRAALDANNIKVDISDLVEEMRLERKE